MIGDMFGGKYATTTELNNMSFQELRKWHKWLMLNRKNLQNYTDEQKRIAAMNMGR